MESKAYLAAYLVKGKKGKQAKSIVDTLVLSLIDESNLTKPIASQAIPLDRLDSDKINRDLVTNNLNDFIGSIPREVILRGIIHKTHSHGTPINEQQSIIRRKRGRAPVKGPNPITEIVRVAIEQVAEKHKLDCESAKDLKGKALIDTDDFLSRINLKCSNASEKRAIMLALKIKNKSYATRISVLEKRHAKINKVKPIKKRRAA